MNNVALNAFFEALANGLWRGCLLVLAAALLLRLVRKTTAAERYAVCLAVLAVIAFAPPAEARLSWARPAPPPMEMMIDVRTAAFATAAPAPIETPQRWEALAVSARPFLLLWSFVGLVLVVRLWRRCLLAAKLKRNARQPDGELTAALAQWESRLESSRVGSTRVSNSLRSPAAVGWLEPAVLLPRESDSDPLDGDQNPPF